MTVLIILTMFAGFAMDNQEGAELASSLAGHSTGGVIILGFAMLRIFWRLGNPPPAHPESMVKGQRIAVNVIHFAFYALMVVVPVTGLLAATAHNVPVEPFWAIDIRPHLGFLGRSNFELRYEIHKFAIHVLQALIILHIVAALVHQFYFRDEIMGRMAWWKGRVK